MRTDFYYESCGIGKIHGCKWTPEGEIKGIVQIIHGIAEHVERYDGFAKHLNGKGFLVVAEDHMGHGKSIGTKGTRGYFDGGWFAAVRDSFHLLEMTREEFPQLPYVLFGHSMGSFMTRTILAKYPESGISAAVICGTGWMPKATLAAGRAVCGIICKPDTEKKPSSKLESLVFGGYNKRVEHRRTSFDWLTRDEKIVDAYIADPLCGFTAAAGLYRDLIAGMTWNEDGDNLKKMNKKLPVYFVSGADDPVGGYGKGVKKAADAFRKSGMQKVNCKLFPMCRHEILNEWNREEIYEDISEWIDGNIVKKCE